jgi:hypothetical protein
MVAPSREYNLSISSLLHFIVLFILFYIIDSFHRFNSVYIVMLFKILNHVTYIYLKFVIFNLNHEIDENHFPVFRVNL